MSRVRVPENETPEEKQIRQRLEAIANLANRSEKTAWNRKVDNMVKMMVELEPVEDEILELIASKKTPILDRVSELRAVMVKECVHPFEYLVLESDNVALCKFCNKKIALQPQDVG